MLITDRLQKNVSQIFLADLLPKLGRGLVRNLPEDLGLLDKVLLKKRCSIMNGQKTHKKQPKVMFVCTAGGARSIFAAGFATQLVQEQGWAVGSGFENCKLSKPINLLFEEVGILAHSRSPKTVFQRYSDKETFDLVVTMCCEAKVDICPSFRKAVQAIYQSQAELIHWDIRDFRGIKESGDAWMDVAREIRSDIKSKTVDFIQSII